MLAALLAGFVDAIVGGGGLITVPALMIALPAGTPLPTLLGTNKVVAVTGASMAAGKFLWSGTLSWREMIGPVLASALGACGGVWLTYRMHGDFLRPIMMVLLVAMLAFTLLKPDLGHLHPGASDRFLLWEVKHPLDLVYWMGEAFLPEAVS